MHAGVKIPFLAFVERLATPATQDWRKTATDSAVDNKKTAPFGAVEEILAACYFPSSR